MEGRVALVTGAGSGIGRATALAFARAGAKVVVAEVVDEAGEQTATQIRDAGGDAHFVRVDVSDPAQVEAMVAAVVDRYGRLDFAHNNAGISGMPSGVVACTQEEWDRTIAMNLTGVWLC